jgi:hypothetical protein
LLSIILVLILLFKPGGHHGQGYGGKSMKRAGLWIVAALVLAVLQTQLSGWIGAYYYKIVIWPELTSFLR